ncbi:hypothetical protein A7X67_02810 [Clostridium sp. W14A]|nr:hypothetical protein A7X67_02810 [Clostridium sp. W14A]
MENEFFQRNRYEKGMLLTAEDQEQQQAYHVEKRRLLNRLAIGSGVVNGFSLGTDDDGTVLTIGAGLALDFAGREIYLPRTVRKKADELLPSTDHFEGWLRIYVRYDESAVGEAAVLPLPDGSHPVIPNRIQESLQIASALEVPADGVELAEVRIAPRDGLPVIADLNPCSRTFRPALFSVKDETKTAASGVLSVNLDRIPDYEGAFYSREVSHGLGPGANISVITAVLDGDGDSGCVISGNSELFGCPLRTAVKLFPERGSFIAAVRPHSVQNGLLRLRWYARKMEDGGETPEEEEPIPNEKSKPENQEAEPAESAFPESAEFLLNPSVAFLRRGQTVKYTPIFHNGISGRDCRFRVADPDGGTIDADGIYMAPDRAGVFEIAASIDGLPEISANALACVLSEEET